MITVAILRAAGASDALIVRVVELEQSERLEARRATFRKSSQKYYKKQRSPQQMVVDGVESVEKTCPPLKKESSFSEESLRPSSSRGARLPSDWQPSKANIEFAREQLGQAWHHERDKFRDYWHAKAGADARKVDWSLTWQNWIRRAAEGRAKAHANGSGRRTSTDFVSNTLLDLWDDRRSKAP